jgi:transcription-repair coupling factor (superfamily II helicase)
MLGNSFGRMIGLGMEGSRLKVVMNVRELEVAKWLTIAENLLKGLKDVKKEEINA